MKRFLLLLSCSLALLLSFPSPSLAANSCVPFRGSGGPPCPIKCFTDNFLACCSTQTECDDLKGGTETPPPGSDYFPPGFNYKKFGLTPPTEASGALCGTGVNLNKGVNTAIGCLMAGDPKIFISQLLGWGVGVGGGIAFLMIVFAGFQMATAAGDPKKVQAARELLMSALSGLILIVLSVVLLNFIGVKILNLPGFNL